MFDGVCNLCNGAVTFIIDRDRAATFSFAPLQSEFARSMLRAAGEHDSADAVDSIVLLEPDPDEGPERVRVYRRSAAALRIVRHLDGAWPLLGALRIVPAPIADRLYDWIARNRYRWFGRQESCRVPTPELAARFLA